MATGVSETRKKRTKDWTESKLSVFIMNLNPLVMRVSSLVCPDLTANGHTMQGKMHNRRGKTQKNNRNDQGGGMIVKPERLHRRCCNIVPCCCNADCDPKGRDASALV